jgi:hypothetical protein
MLGIRCAATIAKEKDFSALAQAVQPSFSDLTYRLRTLPQRRHHSQVLVDVSAQKLIYFCPVHLAPKDCLHSAASK